MSEDLRRNLDCQATAKVDCSNNILKSKKPSLLPQEPKAWPQLKAKQLHRIPEPVSIGLSEREIDAFCDFNGSHDQSHAIAINARSCCAGSRLFISRRQSLFGAMLASAAGAARQ